MGLGKQKPGTKARAFSIVWKRGSLAADHREGSTFTPGPIVEEIATRWI